MTTESHEQVYVVGHQHIGMNGHAMFLSGFIQTCQVIAVVIIRKETGGALSCHRPFILFILPLRDKARNDKRMVDFSVVEA